MTDYIVLGFTIICALLLAVIAADAIERHRQTQTYKRLIKALPWADPAKLIQDADFYPILVQRKGMKDE